MCGVGLAADRQLARTDALRRFPRILLRRLDAFARRQSIRGRTALALRTDTATVWLAYCARRSGFAGAISRLRPGCLRNSVLTSVSACRGSLVCFAPRLYGAGRGIHWTPVRARTDRRFAAAVRCIQHSGHSLWRAGPGHSGRIERWCIGIAQREYTDGCDRASDCGAPPARGAARVLGGVYLEPCAANSNSCDQRGFDSYRPAGRWTKFGALVFYTRAAEPRSLRDRIRYAIQRDVAGARTRRARPSCTPCRECFLRRHGNCGSVAFRATRPQAERTGVFTFDSGSVRGHGRIVHSL